MKNLSHLPEAFSVVSKHLNVLNDLYSSTKTHLDTTIQDPEHCDVRYPGVERAADGLGPQMRTIEKLFATVKGANESPPNLDKYRGAVRNRGGKRGEKVMFDPLFAAKKVVVVPFVTEKQIKDLDNALEGVRNVPASLPEEPKGEITMNNTGSGSQFYHGGTGHQNVCKGGLQVTGENRNAKYFYRSESQDQDGTNSEENLAYGSFHFACTCGSQVADNPKVDI